MLLAGHKSSKINYRTLICLRSVDTRMRGLMCLLIVYQPKYKTNHTSLMRSESNYFTGDGYLMNLPSPVPRVI